MTDDFVKQETLIIPTLYVHCCYIYRISICTVALITYIFVTGSGYTNQREIVHRQKKYILGNC